MFLLQKLLHWLSIPFSSLNWKFEVHHFFLSHSWLDNLLIVPQTWRVAALFPTYITASWIISFIIMAAHFKFAWINFHSSSSYQCNLIFQKKIKSTMTWDHVSWLVISYWAKFRLKCYKYLPQLAPDPSSNIPWSFMTVSIVLLPVPKNFSQFSWKASDFSFLLSHEF